MNQEKDHIDISIPYELARYAVWQRDLVTHYQTNTVIKALGIWLILKHDSTASLIQKWRSQREWLLKICKCNENTFRANLRVLQSLKLISLYSIDRKKDSIRLCSWKHLAWKFSIDITLKLTLQYKFNDSQKVHQWIIATEIEQNKLSQETALIRKLNKNPEVYGEIFSALLKFGADKNRLKDSAYFISMMRQLYLRDFVTVSDIHDLLIQFRPDNNRSVLGIANAWMKMDPGTSEEADNRTRRKLAVRVSYWKGVLQRAGIVDIEKLQIKSQQRARNKHCKVLWLNVACQTLLCLPDQIEIMKPWLRPVINPIQPMNPIAT